LHRRLARREHPAEGAPRRSPRPRPDPARGRALRRARGRAAGARRRRVRVRLDRPVERVRPVLDAVRARAANRRPRRTISARRREVRDRGRAAGRVRAPEARRREGPGRRALPAEERAVSALLLVAPFALGALLAHLLVGFRDSRAWLGAGFAWALGAGAA